MGILMGIPGYQYGIWKERKPRKWWIFHDMSGFTQPVIPFTPGWFISMIIDNPQGPNVYWLV
jgi:hypothetical protein